MLVDKKNHPQSAADGGLDTTMAEIDACSETSEQQEDERRDTVPSPPRMRANTDTLSGGGSLDDSCLADLLGYCSLDEEMPAMRSLVRRTKSCGLSSHATPSGAGGRKYRMMIGYRDEQLRERCQRNTQQLLLTALGSATPEDTSTSTILARKALRYRKILERMQETDVDVSDPSFDLSECLGVRWQRVANSNAATATPETCTASPPTPAKLDP